MIDTTQPDETITPTMTCDRCQCTSTLPDLFRKSWGKHYCPACSVKVEIRNNKWLFGLLGVFILLELIRNGSTYGFTSWEAWSTFSIIVISILSLILHELSHALAAWLLGGQVFGIHLGLGRSIMRRWFKNFYLSISLLPVSGLCYAGFPTTKWLRLRFAIYISAGLFFHLLVLFITIPLLNRTGNRFPFLDAIIILNGLLFLLNVWPRTFTTIAGQTGSDGKRIWQVLTGKFKQEELHQSYFRLAASFAFQREQTEQVSHYVQKGLALYPNDDVLENLRVFLLLNEDDKLEEAYTAWKAIVESEAIDSTNGLLRAVYYNNYAWVTLMYHPDPDSLETAHHFANKAYHMAPWMPIIKGTLAAVFVEQGQFNKGVKWALSVAEEAKQDLSPRRDEHIAANLATAALGCFRMGEHTTALHYLQQAVALAPDEMTTKRAVAEIQAD